MTGAVLLRVQRPSDIPLESLHGRKDDLGRTLRLTTRSILESVVARRVLARRAAGRGDGRVRSVGRLREELEIDDRVNTIVWCLAAEPEPTAAPRATLTDVIEPGTSASRSGSRRWAVGHAGRRPGCVERSAQAAGVGRRSARTGVGRSSPTSPIRCALATGRFRIHWSPAST